MKRFYKNTLISRVSNSALRVVALLCVLLGVSSSAWADTGFHEEEGKALSLRIGDVWYDFGIDGHTGVNHLGNYISGECPKLNEFYYRTFKKNDNVCQTGYILINLNGEKAWGSTESVTDIGSNNEGYTYQRWTGTPINSVLPTNPGTYQFDLYVKAKVGDCNADNWIWLNNGNQNYKFSYNVVKTIYLNGDGAIGAFNWGNAQPAEPTDDKDVVRFKLKSLNNFEFSNSKSQNWNFFRAATYLSSNDEGANIEQIKNGNELNSIKAQISGANRDAGYSEPVYFYYNTSTNKYWVKASQKAAYHIEFEDGTQIGCTDLEKGEACINSIDLGEGTYRFKVYKNNKPYYYNKTGANSTFTDNLAKAALQSGDKYTTLILTKYSTCTFTMQEEGSNFNFTVTSTKLEEPVLIGANPTYSNNNKDALLSAYLQGSLCTEQAIAEYGFVICAGGQGCIPDMSSKKLRPTTTDLFRGDTFTYLASTGNVNDNLIGGVTYGYRAYVTIAGKTYLSRETGYFTLQDDCVQQVAGGEPVVFTIDASLGADYENDCKLTYGSLQTAINKLRDSYENVEAYRYVSYDRINDHETYDLRQPVIFNVRYYDNTPDDQSAAYCYQGNKKAEVSGGGGDSENSLALIFKDFNRFSEDSYTLTVQGASGTNRPWLHHVILRNSRNIVLDNLAIFSDPTGKRQDDALEFDVNTMSWNTISVGECEAANIVVKNCMIGSNGFTGLHASGYDGITFENNEFEAIMAKVGDTGNAVAWGASAKFMFCENIKFIRNNFRGAHATLLWFQDSQNAVFMNNVFWVTNQYDANCAAVRLVNQYGGKPVQNIAFFYNTFYLENNENTQAYDFLHTSTKENDGDTYSNIKFQYNNCYSYDTDVPGKNTDVSKSLTSSEVCPNNFWSTKTGADFSFGDCSQKNVTMDGLICETSATGPASLVIRGGGDLNVGPKLKESNNFAGTGITITEDEVSYDRYNKGARPEEGGWTYGAYQGKEGVEVETIYWVGLSSNWDDRNNWVYFTDNTDAQSKSSSQERGTSMQRLSCINKLSKNLKVIITEKPLVQGSDNFQWPQIPDEFDANIRKTQYGIPTGEQVTAGLGYDGTHTMFADNIEIEYGAAIKGIENLVNGEDHYGSATIHFTAPRSVWTLVGNVVQPFENGTSGDVRNLVSGDYYITTELPRVYMHEVKVNDNGESTWDVPFGSLEQELLPGQAFAIMVPDQYGKYKVPASYYNKKYVTDGNYYDPTEEIVYGEYPGTKGPFTGRFINEKGENPLTYSDLELNQYYILNNSYPCNIDAKEIKTGEVQVFDIKGGSFEPITDMPAPVLLKPQHGFIYKPTSSTTLTITSAMLADGNTRSRAAEIEMPLFSLNLFNANTNTEKSKVVIRYDEFLGEGNVSENNVAKAFAPNTLTPELYIIANDSKYSSIDVPSISQVIPLGIRLKSAMNVRFEQLRVVGFEKVILVDRLKGVECDLLEMPYTTETLTIGDLEGRFFLYLEEEIIDEEPEEGDDTTTEIDDIDNDANSINIFVKEDRNTITIITNGVELETINISDTAGKTMTYKANGYYENIKLPVPKGVYIVQVIGDTASRTEKVILK